MLLILISFIFLLISIGFFSLLERKLLSISQFRLGPNKMMFMGILQPILDGLKLFKKSVYLNLKFYTLMCVSSSIIMMSLSLLLWTGLPYMLFNNKIMVMMWLMLLFGLMGYCILLAGWSSYSKYSFMGSIRGLAQTLSFEICLTLILMMNFIILNKMNLNLEKFMNLLLTPLIVVSALTMLLEAQRAPMDLSEGESELISGFNVETGGVIFIALFLSEYLNLSFLIMLFIMLLFKVTVKLMLLFYFLMIILRSCYPRIRYDILMNVFWLIITPLMLILMFYYLNMKFLIF